MKTVKLMESTDLIDAMEGQPFIIGQHVVTYAGHYGEDNDWRWMRVMLKDGSQSIEPNYLLNKPIEA